MKQALKNFLRLNVVLHLIALCVASYLTYHHYELNDASANFKSFCSINEHMDCDVVNGSAYSEIFSVPIAALAIGYHLLSIFLSFFATKSLFTLRDSLMFLLPSAALAILYSLFLLGISIYALNTTCILCMSLYVMNTLIFIATFLIWKKSEFQKGFFDEYKLSNRKNVMTFYFSAVTLILLTHWITYASFNHDIPFDEDSFSAMIKAQTDRAIDVGLSPMIGVQQTPKIQVVEFADFECPHCRLAARQVHRWLPIYKDKVQFVFKNYPLDMTCNPNMSSPGHMNACIAAKVVFCSNKFNKFLPMYEKVFEKQAEITEDNLYAWASSEGINADDLKKCVNSTQTSDAIRNDIETATTLNIQGTPTFFINGRRVPGILDERALKAAIKILSK